MKKLLALGIAIAFSHPAMATFTDDFESYADDTALNAVWSGGPATLATAVGGRTDQSMFHPGGTVNSVAINETSAAGAFTFSFDFYDDGASLNKRLTGGLRAAGSPLGIIEMGMYNDFSGTGGTAGYGVRTILFPAPDGPNWQEFPNATEAAGWHRFSATIYSGGITFTLDLDVDNNPGVDSQINVLLDAQAVNYTSMRFGGPSNVSSPGGGANMDNVVLTPEPASLSLLALGGLAVLRRRR